MESIGLLLVVAVQLGSSSYLQQLRYYWLQILWNISLTFVKLFLLMDVTYYCGTSVGEWVSWTGGDH